MPFVKISLSIALCILISGCASLSKEECVLANWYDIGFNDGAGGYTRSRFNDHIKACSEYKILPQQQPYMQGRKQGLLSYCTAYNGLNVGLKGRSYNNVCPSKLESQFLKKYRQGKAIYDLEYEIKGHESRIQSLKDKLHDDKKKPSDKKRKKYIREIRDLRIRIEEKNKRLYYLKGQAGV